jgi:O-methyltransferase
MLPSYFDWSSWRRTRESLRRWRLFQRVGGHTVVSREKLNALCTLAATLDRDGIPGAIVECGVFKGGAAALMAHESRNRRDLYLFDSFEGLPPPGPRDGGKAHSTYAPGWCASTEDDVRAVLDRLGCLTPRVHFVKGWFQETFPRVEIDQIALLHIDADWYDSVRLCLDQWFDRVVPGGFVAVDDYGRWVGCTRAVDEFLEARELPPLRPTGAAGHYLRKDSVARQQPAPDVEQPRV